MRSFSIRLSVICALLGALAAWTHARPLSRHVSAPAFAAQIPFAFNGWSGREAPPLDRDVARVLAADEYVHRYYGRRAAASAERVEMDVAYYARPQAGAAMHSPLNCLPGNGWQIVESGPMAVAAGGRSWNVRRLVVDRKGHRVAMAYWFQNRGAVVANEYRQRLLLLTNGFQGQATDAALVRVMTRDTEPGRRAMEDFTRQLLMRLNAGFLPNS